MDVFYEFEVSTYIRQGEVLNNSPEHTDMLRVDAISFAAGLRLNLLQISLSIQHVL